MLLRTADSVVAAAANSAAGLYFLLLFSALNSLFSKEKQP